MLTDAQRQQLKPAVRTMQIIVSSLLFGVLSFLVVVLIINSNANKQPDKPFLTYIGAAFGGVAFLASIFVPMVLGGPLKAGSLPGSSPNPGVAETRANDDAAIGSLAQAFNTLLIIKCALIEGAAFFCLVAYLLEKQVLALGVAGFLAFVLMLRIPTEASVANWIESQLVDAQQMRQFR